MEGIARRPIILCSGLAYRIIIKASHDSNKEFATGPVRSARRRTAQDHCAQEVVTGGSLRVTLTHLRLWIFAADQLRNKARKLGGQLTRNELSGVLRLVERNSFRSTRHAAYRSNVAPPDKFA